MEGFWRVGDLEVQDEIAASLFKPFDRLKGE
jgi:hypothetical protein